MTLPHSPYAGLTAPQMAFLDDTNAALGQIGIIQCTAAGTNLITLQPVANMPTVSAYQNLQKFSFTAVNTSTGPVTSQVGSLAALPVYAADGITQIGLGGIVLNDLYEVTFLSAVNGGNGGFVVLSASATGVTPGVYSSVTVDASGRVTAGGAVSLTTFKNRIDNGACAISQRVAVTLTSSFQYGAVDRYLVGLTAGTVSSGLISATTAAPLGRTGTALQCTSFTTAGSAVVSVKQRIESVNAVILKNRTGSFGARVYQDTGSAINYQITLRKPTAADNYASTTQIAQSGLISVPSATDTQITFVNQSLGDVSAGLEVQVDAQCGAVTGKNLYFTECQMEDGPASTGFDYRPRQTDLALCQRYTELITFFNGEAYTGFSTPGTTARFNVSFAVPKRVTPTAALNGSASWSATNNNTAAAVQSLGTSGLSVGFQTTNAADYSLTLVPGTGGLLVTADL